MRIFSIVLFILVISTFCFAQKSEEKPDFSGTWILDEKKFSYLEEGSKERYKNYNLTIIHKEPELKVTRNVIYMNESKSANLFFYTDKRGESNHPYFIDSNIEVESKTYWKKDIIVREITKEIRIQNKISKIKTKEEYKLSKDKKTLTLLSSTFGDISPVPLFGSELVIDSSYKLVFRKKE